ncbi:site-specific integrase [Streptomyces sp. So13.3]|uniref:tyrosine-type recombinase/integrase n=1 Tax=Streptomyces sp. So13.3 TaxID=2136173 RepID=UPI001106D84D|nr:tyrosine-type recombinase/integrase [Streptomyces sp. So13.3]QNA74178.1 site-specific integrase [Streptomyces sp. So13.3]
MGTRRPNGASSIYKGKDGKWHGRVTVGVKDDGSPDRRHVERKTEAAVINAVRDLEKQREAGAVRKAGKPWTVKAWLVHWLENITAPPVVRESTYSSYRAAVNVHLIPGIGGHRLDKLEPEHLERLYTKMQRNGSKPATAHQAHRTIRLALNEAMRRGHIVRNVASLAKAPRITEEEVDPYSVREVQRLLEEAAKSRNSTRWAIALALGLRQGECLGIQWRDVDFERGAIRVRRNRLRPKYAHGCDEPCGRKHPGYCPQRSRSNKDTDDTKSKAGRRVIGLPEELAELLKLHSEAQGRESAAAGERWVPGDWVFASETGAPLNPRTDYDEWKRLLTGAGVRDGRLHDARHTASTVLLILGVPERTVMAIMGWSSTAMAARYQHVTDSIRQDVAKRVGGLLWERAAKAPESVPEEPVERSREAKRDGN